MKNAVFCHSGLNPESSNDLKTLDSGLFRNDDREAEMEFFKALMEGFLKSVDDAPPKSERGLTHA